MHVSSFTTMQRFVSERLGAFRGAPAQILDIGSQDVNGTYRPLFDDPLWEYVGADMAPGPNVDVVLTDPYDWSGIGSGSFDIVVSGQTIEHVEHPWRTFLEIDRVLRPGGICCIIAPSAGPEHRYPVDCWRVLPDGMRALAAFAGLRVVDVSRYEEPTDPSGAPNVWFDTALIAEKPSDAEVRHMESLLDAPLRTLLPVIQDRIMTRSTYFGIPIYKPPTDAWVYQELVTRLRPAWIVEIGACHGGSTLMLAHLCDLVGTGQVIAVDTSLERVPDAVREHERVTLIEGDACAVFPRVRALTGPDSALVIEDSSHTYENTLAVLRTYAPLVAPDGYLIVEDGICHHGLDVGPAPGPYEAVETFLVEDPRFVADRDLESFVITWNPKGYLRRVG